MARLFNPRLSRHEILTAGVHEARYFGTEILIHADSDSFPFITFAALQSEMECIAQRAMDIPSNAFRADFLCA